MLSILKAIPGLAQNRKSSKGWSYPQIVEPPRRIFYREDSGRVLILHVMRSERLLRALARVGARQLASHQMKYLKMVESMWRSAENTSLKAVLKKVQAGASIHGNLRPNEAPSYKSQVLMVFLVEMEDSRATQELLEMSKMKHASKYSMLGVSEGRLFCLLVGRSIDQGVASFETSERLQRFSSAITEVLKRHAKA